MNTKKDYERAAKLVKEAWFEGFNDDTAPQVKTACATRFARFFEEDNPRFDRARFFEACGINTGISGLK